MRYFKETEAKNRTDTDRRKKIATSANRLQNITKQYVTDEISASQPTNTF